MGATIEETTETAETIAETTAETVTVVQVLPDNINQYIAEQTEYSTWIITLLAIVVGVLLVEVFFDRWKF